MHQHTFKSNNTAKSDVYTIVHKQARTHNNTKHTQAQTHNHTNKHLNLTIEDKKKRLNEIINVKRKATKKYNATN